MIKKTVLLTGILIFLVQISFSQYIGNYDYIGRARAITTAVPFLLISPDSRAGAMGDVGCATSADPNSQHHNPAKYVFNENKIGFSVSYSPWLRGLVNDINLLYLAGYTKVTKMDAIAFSLRYFSLGDIEFMNDEGHSLGTKRPNEFALDFTYSRKLIDELSIAITPRFIYSDLTSRTQSGQTETKPGLAGAADLSLFYEQDLKTKRLYNQTLRAGLNISNIGNRMSYSDGTPRRDFIATNLKLGLGYTMEFNEYNKLSFTTEFNKLLVPTPPVYATDDNDKLIQDDNGEPVIAKGKKTPTNVATAIFQSFADAPEGFKEEMREINFGIGMEYGYRDLLFVRLGYFNESKYKGGRKFFTIGAGIQYNVLGIDVSYLVAVNQNHPLENTLRFTLTFDFKSFNKEEIKKQRKLN